MIITKRFRQAVEKLIAAEETMELPPGVLPIGNDLHVELFLRVDGTVGSRAIDADNIVWHEPSPPRLILSLLIGSKYCPQIAELIPTCPSAATSCLDCSGTGRFPLDCLCSTCGGVGWLGEDYQF